MAGALERLRIERGLSRSELAKRAGVSSESIRRLERGITRTVHMRVLGGLAAGLGTSALDLFDMLSLGGSRPCETDKGA